MSDIWVNIRTEAGAMYSLAFNGCNHNLRGPAVSFKDREQYYILGNRHRLYGYAFDGFEYKFWLINGTHLGNFKLEEVAKNG